MYRLVWGLALGFAMAGSVASADTMEEAVGNTVVVEWGDGSVERYRFKADNTFTVEYSGGEISGTWALNGSKICIDIGDGDPVCEDYPKGKKVGDSWTEVDDDDGSTMTISIEAGG